MIQNRRAPSASAAGRGFGLPATHCTVFARWRRSHARALQQRRVTTDKTQPQKSGINGALCNPHQSARGSTRLQLLPPPPDLPCWAAAENRSRKSLCKWKDGTCGKSLYRSWHAPSTDSSVPTVQTSVKTTSPHWAHAWGLESIWWYWVTKANQEMSRWHATSNFGRKKLNLHFCFSWFLLFQGSAFLLIYLTGQ